MTQQHEGQRAIGTARQVLSALIQAGIRDLVISPGSRSAPLAYAAAEAEAAGKLSVHVRIDERSAAFMALGLAQATGTPAVLAATSGTAIGQMLPALMEANHTSTALLVLSADRPDELLGTGASQSTAQQGLFGAHARVALNVPAGDDPESAVAHALQALRGTDTVPAGPVQLNLQFRDPLTPEENSRVGDQPWTQITPGHWPQQNSWHWPTPPKLTPRRTVVVAGHGAGPEAQSFAAQLGLPLFAEPSSNARFGPNAIASYRPLLAVGMGQIERVVLFGRPTLSRPVGRLLADPQILSVLWEPTPVAWYEAGRRKEQPIADPATLQEFAGYAPANWLESWQQLDAQARQIRAEHSASGALNGMALAEHIWHSNPTNLLVGSSNIVRDFDLAALPRVTASGTSYANRGLAGIDGTISTALGLAVGAKEPVLAVMGDVTFAHDASALSWTPGEERPTVDVVVYNDGGGAIFSTLEHGAVHDSGRYAHSVERLFATPQSLNLSALAQGYGWEYHRAGTAAQLQQILEARQPGGLRLIEVPASRTELRASNLALTQAIAGLPWPTV